MNKRSSTKKADIEPAVLQIQMGLEALHELAMSHENGVSGGTLSVVVEQMSLQMQGDVRRVLDFLDRSA
jgi:hypothetical protein